MVGFDSRHPETNKSDIVFNSRWWEIVAEEEGFTSLLSMESS